MYSRVESTSLETKRMLTQAKHYIAKDKFPKEFDMYLKSIRLRPLPDNAELATDTVFAPQQTDYVVTVVAIAKDFSNAKRLYRFVMTITENVEPRHSISAEITGVTRQDVFHSKAFDDKYNELKAPVIEAINRIDPLGKVANKIAQTVELVEYAPGIFNSIVRVRMQATDYPELTYIATFAIQTSFGDYNTLAYDMKENEWFWTDHEFPNVGSITMRPAISAVINAHSMAELRQPVPVYQAELGLNGIAELDGENAEYFVQAQRKLNRLFRDFAKMPLLTTPINNELEGA